MTRALLLACVVALLATSSSSASAAEPTRVRRFALVIGANDGGTDRVRLRYAGTDAEAVARVLHDLGGVDRDDIVVLLDPDGDGVDAGFDRMRATIAAAESPTVRTELLVYYSGHSDEEGLLLRGERYDYARLRERIRGMPADVNIAILDSCASGAFTRRKGGHRVPPFLVDESVQVKGYAFLTSSSSDEAAQESDRIGASFFTHFLVSGMRGGADANRDGRVTLNEAYQFAFNETVSRTESTQAGPQHPAYDIHLVGTGDVVMTDLRATSAALEVAGDVVGRLFIEDADGRIVVELTKPVGQPIVLGLGPATYSVTLVRTGGAFRAKVALTRGRRTRLALADFAPLDTEPTVVRGGPPGAPVADEPEPEVAYHHVPFAIQFVPTIGTGPHGGAPVLHNVSLNILVGDGTALEGVEVAGVGNLRRGWVEGVQVAGVGNYAGGRVDGLQLAGVGNYAGADFEGGQVGGVINYTRGSFEGAQLGGVANIVYGDFEGLQLAGVANYTRGDVEGVQIGVVNYGGRVRGMQLGVVNYARESRGLQLGLVNYAERNGGAPIGLLSWARNGRFQPELWGSDTGHTHAGVKLGAGRVYTVLAAGVGEDDYLFGLGLGVHTPYDGYYLDIDAIAYQTLDHDFEDVGLDVLGKLRAVVGFELAPHFEVFGGVTSNWAFAFDGEDHVNPSLIGGKKFQDPDFVLEISPGFIAGVGF